MVSKHGFDEASLTEVFGQAKYHPRIVALMDKATKPIRWDEYRPLFVNDQKLAAGERFWRQHRASLESAEERYGVPAEMVVAIIGVETHYGRHTGGFRVLDALKTLAFDYPRRAAQFRGELEHFLLLTREESLAPLVPKGSYAGAMGIAQFMPGSFRRYAVDFDQDGARDLFDNPVDAIGSVANYFTAHGWRSLEPVAIRVAVPDGLRGRFENSPLDSRYRLERLVEDGVRFDGVFEGHERALPVHLPIRGGEEHWLGFDNFYVITRYNRSKYYAMAVFQLSEALGERMTRIEAGEPASQD